MRHLFNSVFRAERSGISQSDGIADLGWVPAGTTDDEKAMLSWIQGRMDLQFVRQGKDAPIAIQAGEAPERSGVFFCGPEYQGVLKAGMRLVSIPNAIGQEPVQGVFDIRAIPDVAIDFAFAHHIEVQVFEMIQRNLATEMPDSSGAYDVEE